MSAIVGAYYLDQRPAEPDNLQRMIDQLAHRGTDGANIWCHGAMGMGHRMLWTTPESLLEQLPLSKGQLTITADARIDNRDELIPALALDGYPSDKITDSEIILAAYRQWGDRCPQRLLGDFAFAIWDGRTQTLFCARDPMGVKPFYYYASSKLFAFASEIKALLCLQEVPYELNEGRIADYLVRRFDDSTLTFYQDIYSLPAASHLMVSRDQCQRQTYWQLDPSHEIRLGCDRDYAEAFLEQFQQAVSCRLRSAFSIGSTMSGGLDSSSIACTARNLLTASRREQLHTFSAIFPSLPSEDLKKIDERPYINAVVEMGNIQAHMVRADLMGPLPDLEQLLWHQEQPFPPPNLYIHLAMYEAAKQQNVRVILEGTDGDTTVSHGLDRLPELALTGQWPTLLSETATFANRYQLPYWKTLVRYGIKPAIYDLKQQTGWQPQTQSANDYPIVNPDFYQRIGLSHRLKTLNRAQPIAQTAREKHALGLASPLFQLALEINDKAAAAYGLEPRYPFFDRRLMEFCVALPAEQKLQQGWGRFIMRRAMQDILPAKIQWRLGKGNLSSNYRRKLLEYDCDTIQRVLDRDKNLISDYINLTSITTELANQIETPMAADTMSVCSSAILGVWLSSIFSTQIYRSKS